MKMTVGRASFRGGPSKRGPMGVLTQRRTPESRRIGCRVPPLQDLVPTVFPRPLGGPDSWSVRNHHNESGGGGRGEKDRWSPQELERGVRAATFIAVIFGTVKFWFCAVMFSVERRSAWLFFALNRVLSGGVSFNWSLWIALV